MKIAFNPSTVAALTAPPNNKDITFDLRGRNIFARGVKFQGTDTNTWRSIQVNGISIGTNTLNIVGATTSTKDGITSIITKDTWRQIKINNVSIGTNILDLRNGSNTTLTNSNGVVTINSTWRPVVDSLTSDSTTSSLSAKQGKVLAGLINGKSDSGHTHDGRYVRAFGTTNDDIDSDWGQSFKTFDPIPSGTPPEKNPNISLLSIGENFNRRKQLAFIYSNDNIYYRRHVNGSFTDWRRLAFANEIPSSLKNPYALTISLNGTSQGPYDGSAAKSINITPGSIGAATSGHNHDGRYVYNYGGTQMDGASRNKNALGMSATSGISGDWWHILQAAWNDEYRWNSQIAFPTQNRNGMYYRSGLGDNTKWGAWVKLLDTGNSSISGNTITINGSSLTVSKSDHNHDYLVVNEADEKSFNSAYHNFQVLYAGGGNGITGRPDNVDAFGLIRLRAAQEWSGQMLLANGGSLYIRSSADAQMTNTLAWRTILDSSNYSSILDSRYYTESEIDTKLAKKLDRVKLTTGSWNPRSYNLAADYHYNGGDLSISETGGQIHVSVDGKFWQNEGQYRVLDTSDIAGIRGSVTLYQYLSSTDTNWFPLIWGGSDHKNTNNSTGSLYKSYDKLSWQTSSQTLYATNIQTENIKHLSIGGGIYWNPYVESATDGSDAASITLVKSGVAGGTTLVLSQMNDANDTIQFKTNTAAKLYHNSYPILTTQNTYVNNHKGYIYGTEITQVNNSNSSDRTRALRYSGTGSSEITAYQTDSSYMGRSGWASYIICNHGDGSKYYSQTIAMPFWGSPIYRRLENGTDRGWKKFYTEENPPSWDNVINKPSSFTPSSHTHTWASITDKLVRTDEFNIVNAGFNAGLWFNYLPINDASKTATVQGYHFGNGNKGYTNIKAAGFIKNGSNSSYVLLGDGGHKTISSLSVNYANSAGSATSATKVIVNQHTTNDINYPLVWSNQANTSNVTENQLYKSWADLYYNPKNKRLTVGGSVVSSSFVKSGGTNQQLLRADGGVAAFNWSGQSGQPTWLWGGNDFNSYYVYNPSNFRVAYAASAGNADTLDGEHANSFVRAGAIEAGDGDLNALDTYSFIKSVNSKVAGHSPKGNIGWYNVIQLVHRNGAYDGPSYIGQIALGMTTNTNDMFFRGKRTDSWKTVIHSGNIGSQSVAYASKAGSVAWDNVTGKPTIPNPANYYWANIKVSASSSTTTSPTVHTLTAIRVCAGYDSKIDNSISCSNWFRSSGNTGWYNATYAGGWYMSDTSWIRAHNNVGIYTGGQIYSSSSIRMSDIYLEHTNEINSASGIYLNYRYSSNVSLCQGGGAAIIGHTPNNIGNNKLYVNGPTTLNSVATFNGLVTNNGGILPASYDVNKNNTECYVWGDAMSTGVTAITDALDPKYVSIHYSNDNGSSWSTYFNDASNIIFNLYANNGNREYMYLGYEATANELAQVQKNQLMVTFEIPDNLYSQLCWASIDIDNGVQTVCTVEIIAENGTIKNTFTKNLYGWNHLNYINFWGNNNAVISVGRDTARFVRFKFKHDANNTYVRNAEIHKIRLFSFTKHSININDARWRMAYTGHLYKYDKDLKVTFPGAVTCNALEVDRTLSITRDTIAVRASNNISLKIGDTSIADYSSTYIDFNKLISLPVIGNANSFLASETYTTQDGSILIGQPYNDIVVKFKPGRRGQLFFMKIGKRGVARVYINAVNCKIIRADGFGIIVNSGARLELYGDGVSRFFIFNDIENCWYEFRCD